MVWLPLTHHILIMHHGEGFQAEPLYQHTPFNRSSWWWCNTQVNGVDQCSTWAQSHHTTATHNHEGAGRRSGLNHRERLQRGEEILKCYCRVMIFLKEFLLFFIICFKIELKMNATLAFLSHTVHMDSTIAREDHSKIHKWNETKWFHWRMKRDNELSRHANGGHLVKHLFNWYWSMTNIDTTASHFYAILKTMQYWQLQLQNWKGMHFCLKGEVPLEGVLLSEDRQNAYALCLILSPFFTAFPFESQFSSQFQQVSLRDY